MKGKQVGQLLLSVVAICTVSALHPLPLFAQSQSVEDEKLHGSVFSQCRKQIEEKENAGCIPHTEALKLNSELFELQKRDQKYTYNHYQSSKNREDFYRHDPGLVSETQSIINHLNLQTTVTEKWKNDAKQKSLGIARPGERPWPPLFDNGQIRYGPKKSGTVEQIGWPMYGWSAEERSNYLSGRNVQ